ncbi:hypothetical protein QJS10_CPB15g00616 [Acorus calamus]|uniref:Uncharacterized protein n=1 Tax=Acorus calamus TaxID=4465 RepID=A0AAV9D4P9_ACOCL|nr:hypothetical protein QJS10_CPB15g00616 [Acorus calamus]
MKPPPSPTATTVPAAGNDCHHRSPRSDLPETTTQSHIRPTKKNSGTGPGNKKNSLSVTGVGVYASWSGCKQLVNGFSADYKDESKLRISPKIDSSMIRTPDFGLPIFRPHAIKRHK